MFTGVACTRQRASREEKKKGCLLKILKCNVHLLDVLLPGMLGLA